jgi:hypothetical protein
VETPEVGRWGQAKRAARRRNTTQASTTTTARATAALVERKGVAGRATCEGCAQQIARARRRSVRITAASWLRGLARQAPRRHVSSRAGRRASHERPSQTGSPRHRHESRPAPSWSAGARLSPYGRHARSMAGGAERPWPGRGPFGTVPVPRAAVEHGQRHAHRGTRSGTPG